MMTASDSPVSVSATSSQLAVLSIARNPSESDFESIELQLLNSEQKKKSWVTDEVSEEYYGGNALEARADLNDGDEAIIAFDNIHKTYLLGLEGVPALRGVSMTVKRGEFLCIFGTSGGGKTTLLNILGTIDRPTKGQLFICGRRINNATRDETLSHLRLNNIGFVFQTFNLLSSLTAVENVEMPMILAGKLNRKERRERAIELLSRVGMADRLDHTPSQLSGGEQQRVTIARAIANNPDILLLDEPTGDLDTVNSALVLKLLMDLNAEGITLIMVTHDVGLKYYSNRVIWMRDGKIAKIEQVSEAKKSQMLFELSEEVKKIENEKSSGTRPNRRQKKAKQEKQEQEQEQSDLESNLSAEFRRNPFGNTQVRRPSDYPTNSKFNSATAQRLESFVSIGMHDNLSKSEEGDSTLDSIRMVADSIQTASSTTSGSNSEGLEEEDEITCAEEDVDYQ